MSIRDWAIAGAALALVANTGCSDEICIQWGTDEGACPAPEEVGAYLPVSDYCAGSVETIDSEGDFVDGACCYDATTSDEEDYCGF